MDSLYVLCLIFIVAPIGTFLHEMGHAAGAKMVKADIIIVSIGLGKNIGVISWHSIKIKLKAFFFIGGYVQSERKIAYKLFEIIWIAICGPLSNAIFAFLFYLLYVMYPIGFFKLLFLFNLWLAVINIIPFKLFGKQSDGYTIFTAIKDIKY